MPRALMLLCVLTLCASPALARGQGDAVASEPQATPEASATPSPRVPHLMFLVTSLAGSGEPGFADGRGARALLSKPSGVTVGPSGLVYVSDTDNHCIRQLGYDGQLKTLAGAPERGLGDGVGAGARFAKPQGIAADTAGNLFVVDRGNLCIRKVSPEGRVSTFAGPQKTLMAARHWRWQPGWPSISGAPSMSRAACITLWSR
jgi:sugar lactone lactonase YvrE